jgi:hypothetical protein
LGERDKVEPFWARPARTKRRGPPSLVVPGRAKAEPEPPAEPPAPGADAPHEPSFSISRQQRRDAIAAIISEAQAPPGAPPRAEEPQSSEPRSPELQSAPSFAATNGAAAPDAHGWMQLTAGAAARHRLYGVRGWLVLVAILIAFELFRALVELIDFWATTDHGGLAAWIMAVLRSVMALWAALILGLLLGCSRAFPINFTAYAMVNVLYVGLFALAFAHVTKGTVFLGMAGAMAMNLVGIAYVLRSRRVNVTCRHRVRAEKSPRPPKAGGNAENAAPAAA